MRRLILILTTLITFSAPTLAVSGNALAADVFQPCGSNGSAGNSDVCKDANAQHGNGGTNNPIIDIIKAAINILSFIIGVAAVIGIVVSGIRLMTSGGDSQAVASARSGLVYSLVGIAVVALAQLLVAYVLGKV